MEYAKLGKEQKREMLENMLANLEAQHYGRVLDVEKWEAILADPLTAASKHDTRILNNRDQEAKANLAGALYDIRKLEISIEQAKAQLAALGEPSKK